MATAQWPARALGILSSSVSIRMVSQTWYLGGQDVKVSGGQRNRQPSGALWPFAASGMGIKTRKSSRLLKVDEDKNKQTKKYNSWRKTQVKLETMNYKLGKLHERQSKVPFLHMEQHKSL